MKALIIEALVGVLVGNTLCIMSPISARRNRCCLHDSTGRGQVSGLCLVFPATCTSSLFLILVYPFAAIICDHDYNASLSSVNPSSELGGPGDP